MIKVEKDHTKKYVVLLGTVILGTKMVLMYHCTLLEMCFQYISKGGFCSAAIEETFFFGF